MADRHDWEAVLLANLPPALVAFVSDLKLPPRYTIALDELGYDDVDDLANLDAAAMAKFRFDLEEKEFKVPHVDKIVRAIDGKRGPQQPAGVAAAIVPNSAPASSTFSHPAGGAAVPMPAAVAAAPQSALHLGADGVLQIAAHDVGAIAAQNRFFGGAQIDFFLRGGNLAQRPGKNRPGPPTRR